VDELNRLAVANGVRRAQDRVPFHERLGGAFQRRHVEVAADLAGIGDRVSGAARCEFMKEPQGPLSVRQWMHRGRDLRPFHEEAGQQCALLLRRETGDIN
jgi:hypothetical protein